MQVSKAPTSSALLSKTMHPWLCSHGAFASSLFFSAIGNMASSQGFNLPCKFSARTGSPGPFTFLAFNISCGEHIFRWSDQSWRLASHFFGQIYSAALHSNVLIGSLSPRSGFPSHGQLSTTSMEKGEYHGGKSI